MTHQGQDMSHDSISTYKFLEIPCQRDLHTNSGDHPWNWVNSLLAKPILIRNAIISISSKNSESKHDII